MLVAIGEAGREADVELIVVDEAEGHPDFRGLGELAPTELEALWPARVPLTADIAKLAARAWDAVCAPDPTQLAALLDADTTALPLLAPAMGRWLEELPDTTSGLALSERRVLDALADRPRTRQELFLGSMEGERLLLNGDAWFFRRLDELGDLVADVGADRVAITETGRRVLAGELDAWRSPAWTAGSAARTLSPPPPGAAIKAASSPRAIAGPSERGRRGAAVNGSGLTARARRRSAPPAPRCAAPAVRWPPDWRRRSRGGSGRAGTG